MRIAITGTRGIPNRYGGFEQFAEYLSVGLSIKGHEVWVYSPQYHPFLEPEYQDVKIVRVKSPEKLIGSPGNYLYDLNCLKDAIFRKPDVLLECGYASAAPWYSFLRRDKIKLVTHMDGMEWQRKKWGMFTRRLFRQAEKKAVEFSDAIICDHPEIADYYQKTYSVRAEMIAYGAEIREEWDSHILEDTGLEPGNFMLIIARMEPENNIRMIIEGFLSSDSSEILVIVGDYSGKYGRLVYREYGDSNRLNFMGGIFEKNTLDHLRHFSKATFHGHSVGGTNPSLLEAMAAGSLILAHENPYNKWILGENAEYFSSSGEITELLSHREEKAGTFQNKINNNLRRVKQDFQWESIVGQYEELFKKLAAT